VAQRKLTMRKTKEILRMKWEMGFSDRQVAASLRISHSTVGDYVRRAEQTGLDWAQVEKLGETELKSKLFPQEKKKEKPNQRPLPDWEKAHQELHHPGVTRKLLWREYIGDHPGGYGYSQFCELYHRWAKSQDKPVMRVPKKAGEEVQVDYAGQTVSVIDPETGEKRKAQLFVGVLGASGLIYAEAHWDQSLPNWTRAHVRMFEFFGGVPQIIKPDNLKAGVTKASFYDPDLNPTYHEMAVHYGAAVIPTRVSKPKDKALVENAVLQVERWVLAALRNVKFFSLYELNQAIREQLNWLNNRQLSNRDLSRQELFLKLEKQALRPLPEHPFEYLEVKRAKVHIDYHVTFKKHHYSVPHQYIQHKVLIRATERLVTIYHENRRIAHHVRYDRYGYSTDKSHLPSNHRWYLEWTPERFCKWARQIGPNTEEVVSRVLASRQHPQQAYRACLGILKFADRYSPDSLEEACQQAHEVGVYSYRAIKRLLTTKKDMLKASLQRQTVSHEHVRGNIYYT